MEHAFSFTRRNSKALQVWGQTERLGTGWTLDHPCGPEPRLETYLSHRASELQPWECQTTEPRSWNTTQSAPPLAGHLEVLGRRSGTQGTGQLAVISWVVGQKTTERKGSNPCSDAV